MLDRDHCAGRETSRPGASDAAAEAAGRCERIVQSYLGEISHLGLVRQVIVSGDSEPGWARVYHVLNRPIDPADGGGDENGERISELLVHGRDLCESLAPYIKVFPLYVNPADAKRARAEARKLTAFFAIPVSETSG